MEDRKEKKGLKESWLLHQRAVGLLHRYCPGALLSYGLYSLVTAVTPYVTVYFSARIIEELAGQRRPEILWHLVWLTVVIGGVLLLTGYGLNRWKSFSAKYFSDKEMQAFVDKQLAMDYADIEKQEMRDLLSQILENENWCGRGLPQLLKIVSEGVQGIVGVIGAVILVAGLFLARVPESAGALTALDSPLALAGLFLALLLPALLSSFLMLKAGQLLQTAAMAENARFGNRAFSFYGFLAYNWKRALDIRIYDQWSIASYYGDYINKNGGFVYFEKLAKGMEGLLCAISACMPAILTGVVYVYVCMKAWAGAFGVGMVTQYVSAVTALTTSVEAIFRQVAELRNNGAYLENVFQYLDIPNAMYQGSLTTEKRSDRQYEVEFRDVSFRYPGSTEWALRHVSIKFRVGRRLAVVGENGSGKTTFIKLLCRLYDPQEGQILLNGIDIRKYSYQDYIHIFSVVFQDFQLLSQPLGANVAGGMDYDREHVLKCLDDAGFGERLASLPDGLDTQLYRDFDENGVMLSGGEAQKIAIARAICKDAPFIILDEPTAALDPIAEAEIYAHFNEISGDRTAIYISHRLSSCRFCDEILVFDHGYAVQQGRHEALLAEEGGKYHQLWHAQAQYYTEEDS